MDSSSSISSLSSAFDRLKQEVDDTAKMDGKKARATSLGGSSVVVGEGRGLLGMMAWGRGGGPASAAADEAFARQQGGRQRRRPYELSPGCEDDLYREFQSELDKSGIQTGVGVKMVLLKLVSERIGRNVETEGNGDPREREAATRAAVHALWRRKLLEDHVSAGKMRRVISTPAMTDAGGMYDRDGDADDSAVFGAGSARRMPRQQSLPLGSQSSVASCSPPGRNADFTLNRMSFRAAPPGSASSSPPSGGGGGTLAALADMFGVGSSGTQQSSLIGGGEGGSVGGDAASIKSQSSLPNLCASSFASAADASAAAPASSVKAEGTVAVTEVEMKSFVRRRRSSLKLIESLSTELAVEKGNDPSSNMASAAALVAAMDLDDLEDDDDSESDSDDDVILEGLEVAFPPPGSRRSSFGSSRNATRRRSSLSRSIDIIQGEHGDGAESTSSSAANNNPACFDDDDDDGGDDRGLAHPLAQGRAARPATQRRESSGCLSVPMSLADLTIAEEDSRAGDDDDDSDDDEEGNGDEDEFIVSFRRRHGSAGDDISDEEEEDDDDEESYILDFPSREERDMLRRKEAVRV